MIWICPSLACTLGCNYHGPVWCCDVTDVSAPCVTVRSMPFPHFRWTRQSLGAGHTGTVIGRHRRQLYAVSRPTGLVRQERMLQTSDTFVDLHSVPVVSPSDISRSLFVALTPVSRGLPPGLQRHHHHHHHHHHHEMVYQAGTTIHGLHIQVNSLTYVNGQLRTARRSGGSRWPPLRLYLFSSDFETVAATFTRCVRQESTLN